MAKKKNNQRKPIFNEILAQVKRNSAIPPAKPPQAEMVFSFKYLHDGNPKFRLSLCEDAMDYATGLMDRLREVCHLSLNEFTIPPAGTNPKSRRSHDIDFSRTSEKDGFPYPTIVDLWKERPWQFMVDRKDNGRVHGFLKANIFYVVWLDPKHKLYA